MQQVSIRAQEAEGICPRMSIAGRSRQYAAPGVDTTVAHWSLITALSIFLLELSPTNMWLNVAN